MTLHRDNIDRLMEVMTDAFDPAYGEAWTRRQVEDALLIGNSHYLLIDCNGTIIRADDPPITSNNEIAGFSLTRQGYDEEELLLFAVRQKYRRIGIGRQMLHAAFSEAEKRGSKRMLLEMRKGNPAEFLYTSCGFMPIGERRDYYRTPDGSRISAITFARDLQNEA